MSYTPSSEIIEKYQKYHINMLEQLAKHLDVKDFRKGIVAFKIIAENLAREAVMDRLTLEEALDGTIFLKQAIWKCLEKTEIFK